MQISLKSNLPSPNTTSTDPCSPKGEWRTETFGPEHRPVVEFALEDVRKLRLRKSRLEMQKGKPVTSKGDLIDLQQDSASQVDADLGRQDKQRAIKVSKPKRYNKSSKASEAGNRNGQFVTPVEGIEVGDLRDSGNTKHNESASRDKRSKFTIKEKGAKFVSQPSNMKEDRYNEQKLEKGNHSGTDGAKVSKEVPSFLDKRKLRDMLPPQEHESKTPKKKKAKSGGEEVADKLDTLIEQYRAKFSRHSLKKSGDSA
ncbi:hypothetical protein Taro_007681, partial [Colocasia esculenta]|nr:hypothetical protein [Colocasia esculenta]